MRSTPAGADHPKQYKWAHNSVWSSARHWQPVRKTKEIASAQVRSGTRGRPPPKRWLLTWTGRSGWSMVHNSSEIRNPVVVRLFGVRCLVCLFGASLLMPFSIASYSDRLLVRNEGVKLPRGSAFIKRTLANGPQLAEVILKAAEAGGHCRRYALLRQTCAWCDEYSPELSWSLGVGTSGRKPSKA